MTDYEVELLAKFIYEHSGEYGVWENAHWVTVEFYLNDARRVIDQYRRVFGA